MWNTAWRQALLETEWSPRWRLRWKKGPYFRQQRIEQGQQTAQHRDPSEYEQTAQGKQREFCLKRNGYEEGSPQGGAHNILQVNSQ